MLQAFNAGPPPRRAFRLLVGQPLAQLRSNSGKRIELALQLLGKGGLHLEAADGKVGLSGTVAHVGQLQGRGFEEILEQGIADELGRYHGQHRVGIESELAAKRIEGWPLRLQELERLPQVVFGIPLLGPGGVRKNKQECGKKEKTKGHEVDNSGRRTFIFGNRAKIRYYRKNQRRMHLSEILNQLGENRDRYFNAVSPPVIQTSNFAFSELDDFRRAMSDELAAHLYTRGNNPTVHILRQKLAALEGAEDALVFGSGVAAVAAAILAQVRSGDHIVCVRSPYSWTKSLLMNYLPRFGVEHTFVDGTDLGQIEAAIRPNTRLLYLESPNSLTFELQDLEACARLAKRYGLVSCIDNSHCSPIFQQPIRSGIDLVVHSGTKYLNGHSDVVLGVLCGSREMVKRIFETEYMTLGAILPPHDAALVLRGLRTLPLRMERIDRSTRMIVERLERHPKVERLHYPLSPSSPQYELARRQMSGAGGLFSLELRADSPERMEAFFRRLQRFLLAVSWGGHESLVLPFVGFYGIPGRPAPELPWNFVRFYIGLEDPEWLWEDLQNALEIL